MQLEEAQNAIPAKESQKSDSVMEKNDVDKDDNEAQTDLGMEALEQLESTVEELRAALKEAEERLLNTK